MPQANSNFGLEQGGNFLFGGNGLFPAEVAWDGARGVHMNAGAYDQLGFFDDFIGAAVSTKWATDISSGGAAAINAQQSGVVRISMDNTDDDHATLALGLHWLMSKGPTFFEARIKHVTATPTANRAAEIGLSDALSETAGLAFSSHVVASPTAVADNAAIFGYDSDGSVTTYAALAVKAAGTPQAVDTAVAPSTSFARFGIVIDASGNAYFYVDGVLKATITSAVATTALLTPWLSLKNLSAAVHEWDIDYVLISAQR